MLSDELSFQIEQHFQHALTTEQRAAVHEFARFLTDPDDHCAMIFRGCAGTGKTTVASAIVRTLRSLRQRVVLLAPTGRAAKVFAMASGENAYTIHRKIYRQQGLGGRFKLADNRNSYTLYIIDESSMIANEGFSDTEFGSGRLLDDLIQFVYGGNHCRMLLLGDVAQLPPVGETESPALQTSVIQQYGLRVYEANLHQVLRQAQESGILYNATLIRNQLLHDEQTRMPIIHLKGFADIQIVNGSELIDALASSYREVGIDETLVVTRSNKLANIYNLGIRNQILDYDDILCRGDLLMIVRNKYLDNAQQEDEKIPDFIANGDRAVVRKIRNTRFMHGFKFADVTLKFPDYDNFTLETTALLTTLTSESASLSSADSQRLYESVIADYADLRTKTERFKALRKDIYYNALQVKYAYAVTCHKAQGGQWAHVYIEQGYLSTDILTPDYIHWLYTAFTRATEKLYLINWKENFTDLAQ